MWYPNITNTKKRKKIINLLLIISIAISILLFIINKLTSPNIHWSEICILGIVYIWITTIYALNKNTNIAAYVLLQSILISIITIVIDFLFGFRKWSLYGAIPIIIITANISMLILTIISHRKYIRYTIYQLTLCLISISPIILISENLIRYKTLSYVAIGISFINLLITILLCKNDIKDELKRKFHM